MGRTTTVKLPFCIKFVSYYREGENKKQKSKESEKSKMDKERYFQQVIEQYALLYPIGYEERTALLNIMTKTFADVDMNTEKKELSVEGSANEVIFKNFIGVKQLGGKKPSTLRNYSHTIKFFLDNTGYDLINTTTNDIRRFLIWYQNRGASKLSTDNTRRVLNIFFQFMEDEGYIDKNPCKRIPFIKCDKPIKLFLTDANVEAMRDACKAPRELAIVDFLTSTGVRVSEMSNIKLSDINWIEKSVLIHGKGGKDRYVFMNARALKHIQDYIKERPQSNWLFAQNNKPYDNLKINSLNHIVTAVGKRVGIDNVTVHTFRRWFANDLNKKGVDIRIIQQLLGHESFDTTQSYYLQFDVEKAKQAHNIYSN